MKRIKTQVSFSDRNLSVNFSVVNAIFSHSCLLLQNKWSISTKLGTKHPRVKGIQVCSNEGPRSVTSGDNSDIEKIRLRHSTFKNLLENQWANFNQTLHKASMC